MSSILVKNMQMPEKCDECIFCGNGYCTITKQYFRRNAVENRPKWCPIVDGEVYEDALKAEILRYGEVYDKKGNRYGFE